VDAAPPLRKRRYGTWNETAAYGAQATEAAVRNPVPIRRFPPVASRAVALHVRELTPKLLPDWLDFFDGPAPFRETKEAIVVRKTL
jgi:hypothetical protein